MPRKPTGPREGDEFGYDPAKSFGRKLAQGMREFEETADERGELKPLGKVAGLPQITRVKKRLIDAHVAITMDAPEELAFFHSISCQCAMPVKRPPADLLFWKQVQGRAVLMLEAGKAWQPEKSDFVQLGLPYGPKARLILMHLNSEAIRNGSPLIDAGSSLTNFIRRIQNHHPTGPELNAFKQQLSRLSAATIRLAITEGERAMQVNTQIVGAFDLWFPLDEKQRVLWPSTVHLSTDYFNSLAKYAVPLDDRAIAALAHSALALDVYCWLAQRLHRIPQGAPQLVPWANLHDQFGQGYAEIRNFRRDMLKMLKQVKTVYQQARLDNDKKGIWLWNSPPPVKKRLMALPNPKTIEHDTGK
jgi:hypothetical protein